MTYRVTSTKYIKNNFWYINPPKTGTQAVRKWIENLPEDQWLDPKHMWHRTAQDILNENDEFFPRRDNFFTTIRNPWARAASYYFYQKKRLEERAIAYSSAEAADEYVKKYPLHYFDYRDKQQEIYIYEILERHMQTFEQFITKIPVTKGYRYITKYQTPERVMNNKYADICYDMRFFSQYEYYYCEKNNPNFLFDIDNVELLEKFLSDTFGAECKLEQINVSGKGKEYRDLYSRKMVNIIREYERHVIDLAGYKF